MDNFTVKGIRGEARVYECREDLEATLADHIAQLSETSVMDRGCFAVALTGGSLISSLRKLCEVPYTRTVDWTKWYVFWTDERVVSKTHDDSNYKHAIEKFLSKVPILSSHVFSINDSLSAEDAAVDYQFVLRQLVKTRTVSASETGDCPMFDLILLSMGSDGHVASLFPSHSTLEYSTEWVIHMTDAPEAPPERITFTLPVINAAANVVMVVTGEAKAEAAKIAIGSKCEGDDTTTALPAQLVYPTDGKLVWFLDKAAASKLDAASKF